MHFPLRVAYASNSDTIINESLNFALVWCHSILKNETIAVDS
jgi:hypothetical protein